MKNLIILCLLAGISWKSYGQDSTKNSNNVGVISSKKEEVKPEKPFEQQTILSQHNALGGYIGFTPHYTTFDNRDAMLLGGRLCMVINHGLAIGIGGYGLASRTVYRDKLPDEKAQLTMGYGGIVAEPIIASSSAIHLTCPVLLGLGGAAYITPVANYNTIDEWEPEVVEDGSVFFVAEPGVSLELNVTKIFRVGLDFSYRFTESLDLFKSNRYMLNGWNAGMTLKLGIF